MFTSQFGLISNSIPPSMLKNKKIGLEMISRYTREGDVMINVVCKFHCDPWINMRVKAAGVVGAI